MNIFSPIGPVEPKVDPEGRYGVFVNALGRTGFELNAAGYIIAVVFETIRISDSPSIIYLDPPVASVDKIDVPAVLRALADKLQGV